MIRVLIAERLQPKVLDLLNEIPEFEISEKTGLAPEQLLEEIKGADAMIAGGSLPLGEEIFKQAGSLKLVILSGPGPRNKQAAQRHGIEIRSVAAVGGNARDAAGLETIAILKDFFNV